MTVKQKFHSFEAMLTEANLPVLVDFYATWCGPCQMMAGILEQVNARLNQRLKVVKIDTEKYPKLASRYQVAALPTLVLFKNGQIVNRLEGVLPVEQLIQWLQPHL